MRTLALVAILALAAPSPAAAAHCPHGQLWRIRMGRCVSLSSPLAYAFEPHRIAPAAEKRDWYVEITQMPPMKDERTPEQIADQAEHDRAVEAKKGELNFLLELLRIKEQTGIEP